MEVEAKVVTVHIIAALVAAFLSFLLSTGAISGVGTNEALATLVGLVILYLSGQLSEKLFGKEAVGGFKGWLWSGIVPFLLFWYMLWTMFMNLL
ncbi:MAG: hypothetical protein QM405_05025 [Euryarchaeota archaeon]|jgi:hypothetical protein|nr:hypothetical protein [Euryarchaeota archaeon]